MINIDINASKQYTVTVGYDLLDKCGEMILEKIKGLKPGKAVIVTDDNVVKLYAEIVKDSFERSGFTVFQYVFKHGEKNKNINTVNSMLEFFAENNVARGDIVIALGGGVTGDAAGFCASVYLRGINYIQIPTTILAAIDSSVGGKTAVNLNAGKNLAGAFWQPMYVICDCACFKTLPGSVYSDGMAEAVKYGVINDNELFENLKSGNTGDIAHVVKRCVEIKRDYILKDEFDTGERQILNFGHTFGHAIEKCSNYTVSHGHAVSVGMIKAAEIGLKLGVTKDEDIILKLKTALYKYALPAETRINSAELAEAIYKDKKINRGYLTFVLPERIGNCVLYKIPLEILAKVIL